MVESFSNTFCCRMCKMPPEGIKEATKEIKKKIRKSFYEKFDSRLNLKENLGVKKKSKLNEVVTFQHLIDLNTQDILHDFYEGVVPKALTLMFNVLIETKKIKLIDIRSRLGTFCYGRLSKKYKPSKLNLEKSNLNQSAAQMKTLLSNFPYIFDDILEDTDVKTYYELIYYLLKIMMILESRVILKNDLKDLNVYVKQFLECKKEVYGVTFTLKDHNLLHYSRIIERQGPPYSYNTMRYESKHRQFTDSIKKHKNFKNILQSVLTQHQSIMAAKWGNLMFKVITTTGKTKLLTDSTWVLEQLQLDKSTTVYKTNRIEHGILYNTGLFVADLSSNSIQFNKIIKILIIDAVFYLEIEAYSCCYEDTFYNSYILEDSPIKKCVLNFDQLSFPYCFEAVASYKNPNKKYIVSKFLLNH